MADYWKSQPKKFCAYCKCWIADNKPSIEFHERGKNHKENVVNKINEIKQKSVAKAKKDQKMAKEFAAMEEAALKAYEEDLKRLEGTEKPAPLAPVGPTPEEKKARDEQKWKEIDAIEKHHAKRKWTKAFSPEGYPYYYNTLTGATQWEEPEGFKENSETSEEQGAKCVWVEGVSEEGYTYYYNSETGESRWEKPDDFESGAPSIKDQKMSPATEDTAADAEKEAANQEEEPKATSEEAKSAEDTTPAAPLTKMPKINFRIKKEDQKDNSADGQEEGTKSKETDETNKEKTDETNKEKTDETNKEKTDETNKEKTDETNKEKTDETNKEKTDEPPKELPCKKPKRPNPYGAWEEVVQEEDPYEKVDLELPNVEYDEPQVQVPDVPEEPKVKFKEKTITSLGDSVTGDFVFKKRRLENVRSRKIRQRLDD